MGWKAIFAGVSLFATAFMFFSASAGPGGSRPIGLNRKQPTIECELLLVEQHGFEQAQRRLRQVLSNSEFELFFSPLALNPHARMLRALGLADLGYSDFHSSYLNITEDEGGFTARLRFRMGLPREVTFRFSIDKVYVRETIPLSKRQFEEELQSLNRTFETMSIETLMFSERSSFPLKLGTYLQGQEETPLYLSVIFDRRFPGVEIGAVIPCRSRLQGLAKENLRTIDGWLCQVPLLNFTAIEHLKPSL